MKIIGVEWRSGFQTIGFVATQKTHGWKAYVGLASGLDEDADAIFVAEHGVGLPELEGRAFFPQFADQTAVAFLAGYTYGGGAFNNPKGRLRAQGLVEYLGARIKLTGDGRDRAQVPDGVLTTDELHRRVLNQLPGPERKILEVLLAAYPEPIANDECAERSGYTPDGGAYNNPRGRLRSLGLIEYRSGKVVARSILFPE